MIEASGSIRAAKMSGAGNDFIVVRAGQLEARGGTEEWVRRVCRRGLSLGADGVLLVDRAKTGGEGRIRVRFLNPDASETFCGNGTRCAARWAHWQGLAPARMTLETAWGDVPAEVDGPWVSLHLPLPRDLGPRSVEVAGETLAGRHVSAGVPHFVVPVSSVSESPLERWGPLLRRHPDFGPEGVNVDLVERAERASSAVHLRTWERGVEGETLACGSGALAAAYALHLESPQAKHEMLPASRRRLVVAFGSETTRMEGDALLLQEGLVLDEALAD